MNFCVTPSSDIRDTGTCVRGTPGCHIYHPITEPLPTILHLGGNGPVNP